MDVDAVGIQAYELMERLFPLCRSLTGSGVRATFDVLEEHIPLTAHRGCQRHAGVRLDRAGRVEHPRRVRRHARRARASSTSAGRPCTSSPTASRCARECRSSSCASDCTRCPTSPTWSPTGPPTTTAPGASASRIVSCWSSAPGDYEVVIDSTLEPGHLTYGELRLEGASDDEVLISTYVCHPSLANDNLSGIAVATMLAKAALAATAAAHLPLPVRARHDRPAGMAAPEPATARPHQARPDRLVHRRRRRPHLQAQPARRRRGRPRGRARAARLGRSASRARLGAVGRRRAPVLLAGLRPAGRLPDAHAARRVRRLPHLGRRARADPAGVARRVRAGLPRRRRRARDQSHAASTSARTASRSSAAAASTGQPAAPSTSPDDERALLWVLNLSDGARVAARHRRALRARLPGHQARG